MSDIAASPRAKTVADVLAGHREGVQQSLDILQAALNTRQVDLWASRAGEVRQAFGQHLDTTVNEIVPALQDQALTALAGLPKEERPLVDALSIHIDRAIEKNLLLDDAVAELGPVLRNAPTAVAAVLDAKLFKHVEKQLRQTPADAAKVIALASTEEHRALMAIALDRTAMLGVVSAASEPHMSGGIQKRLAEVALRSPEVAEVIHGSVDPLVLRVGIEQHAMTFEQLRNASLLDLSPATQAALQGVGRQIESPAR